MPSHPLIEPLLAVGRQIRAKVHRSLLEQSHEERSAVFLESADDTIYQIDRDVEDILLPTFEAIAGDLGGVVLVAEGLSEGKTQETLPHGLAEEKARWRVLMDPIDGTRGIMYDKRSAFYLAGVAPNKGENTCLQDIEAAVMVELPTSRSVLSDVYWAVRGQGAHRQTEHLETGITTPRPITPSKSKSIYGGFAQISRFFPPGREVIAALEEEMIGELFPNAPEGRTFLFEDQYISTGGQINELLLGHDRFTADIRAGLFRRFQREGRKIGLIAHPYDLSAYLIGVEAGIHITALDGSPLNAPFDTTAPMDWIGYANASIRAEVEPVLQRLLRKYGILV